MEREILEFGRLLRHVGLNTSFPQIRDALRAAAAVGFDCDDFYLALSSNFVLDRIDQPLFDRLFRLYFLTLNRSDTTGNSTVEATTTGQDLTMHPDLVASLVSSVTGEGLGRGAGASPLLLLIGAVRQQDYTLLQRLAKVAVQSLGTVRQEQLPDLEQLLMQARVAIGWYEAVNRLERIRKQEKIAEVVYDRWQDAFSFLGQRIEELLHEVFVRRFGQTALEEIARSTNLSEKEFFSLTNDETDEIRKRITRLARKLASRYSRRYHRTKNGEIDLRRTIREAMRHGGRPLRLRYRSKMITKPDLVLLCDVSGSVARFSEFMLQLVYTIQSHFRTVRSFLFVDKIDEVSGFFAHQDLEQALQTAFLEGQFSYSGFSDIGSVFRLFTIGYLSGVSTKSTVIILGDAKNNWHPDEHEFLKEIADRVHRVYWLNPQPICTWNSEDSIMETYAPYCRQVFECHNLRQLEDMITTIF